MQNSCPLVILYGMPYSEHRFADLLPPPKAYVNVPIAQFFLLSYVIGTVNTVREGGTTACRQREIWIRIKWLVREVGGRAEKKRGKVWTRTGLLLLEICCTSDSAC